MIRDRGVVDGELALPPPPPTIQRVTPASFCPEMSGADRERERAAFAASATDASLSFEDSEALLVAIEQVGQSQHQKLGAVGAVVAWKGGR